MTSAARRTMTASRIREMGAGAVWPPLPFPVASLRMLSLDSGRNRLRVVSFFRKLIVQDFLNGHHVTAVKMRLEEIALALPMPASVLNLILIVVATKGRRNLHKH